MKGIMGRESSKPGQNVPSFSYCAADKSMSVLFELARPLDDLENMLVDEFAGQTLTTEQNFDKHQGGRHIFCKTTSLP